MLARLDQLDGELNSLLDALRRSGERLSEGLAQLHEQVQDVSGTPADEAAAPPAEPEVAAPADPPAANGDEAGARLIALNMALSGTPREETARYLADNYTLDDPEGLLDDVYDRAGR
jgi:hypothetical protein